MEGDCTEPSPCLWKQVLSCTVSVRNLRHKDSIHYSCRAMVHDISRLGNLEHLLLPPEFCKTSCGFEEGVRARLPAAARFAWRMRKLTKYSGVVE